MSKETIAILGGTGDLGTGLAIRWSKAGYKIVIGSRTVEKAEAAVAALQEISPDTPADAKENLDAAAAGDIVVLTVPAEHQISTLDYVKANLTGKILIDVTVPLVPPKVGTVQLPPEGSAGKRAQDHLGEDVMVVTAYQNIAAHLLQQDVSIECDVLVCGNKKAARERVIELTEEAGMTGWHAGPVANSAAAEALTSILIQINRGGKLSHSGIKIMSYRATMSINSAFSVVPVPGMPMVESGDDLSAQVLAAIDAQALALVDGDVICLAQKVVSKAEGRQIPLEGVVTSDEAQRLAEETDKDPRLVQLILDESTEILRQRVGVLIVRHKLGLVGAHAGIDQSNVDHAEGEQALLLPVDPDASAAKLRQDVFTRAGVRVGVIITDSHNRPWRMGTIGAAIGCAGITVLDDHRGGSDVYGRELKVTLINRADALAAAATLVMGETTEKIPLALIRGLPDESDDTVTNQHAQMINRPLEEDLFR